MTDRVHSTGTVALYMRLRPCTIQAYAREGRIPFDVTPGGHRRFDLNEVRGALAEPFERKPMTEVIGAHIKWQDDVADHDYKAAGNYLTLKMPSLDAVKRVTELREAPLGTRRANDILRACHLAPLPLTDPGVLRDLKKVLSGEKLSPVLVACDDIADGYHRVSLAYALDPFADVPLKIGRGK